MAKSIMQDKTGGECYLCNKLLGIDAPAAIREEHHTMHGTANRKLAERYGLKVYLCLYHHRGGPEAVHRSPQTDLLLKQDAQKIFERKYGHAKWIEVFKKNYLDSGEQDSLAAGPAESPDMAAGQDSAATSKNQPFDQINISQNPPEGFRFL